MTEHLDGLAPVAHLGVIRAAGADAASFLHGQLTQDIEGLDDGRARLAAYCSAKGRMLASFVVLRWAPDEILLICSRDLLPAALKRLSMFVLRAKARLSDASAEFELRGVAGSALAALCGPDAVPGTLHACGPGRVAVLPPADGVSRGLWLAPAGSPLPAGTALAPALWQWGEVRSGVATLSAAVVEAFVPQMLNYESVDGVNFRKGCYPGQEVVARSQYRGTLKRRAYLVHGNAPLHAGQDVFHISDPEQPAGMVVQAAPAPQGGWDAIVSLQVAAATDGLTAGRPDGPALALMPLPYRLLD